MNAIDRNQTEKRKMSLPCVCHGFWSIFIEWLDVLLVYMVILLTDELFRVGLKSSSGLSTPSSSVT